MRLHFSKHGFNFKGVNNNAVVFKCKVSLLAFSIYISDNKLCFFRKIKNWRFFYCTSRVIPYLILVILTDRDDILVDFSTQLTVDHDTGMLIHVFYTLVVLEIPHFYVALTYCYQDIFLRNRVDHINPGPVTFIHYTQLALHYVY